MTTTKLFLFNTNVPEDLLVALPFELPDRAMNIAVSFSSKMDRNNFVAARWMLYEYCRSANIQFSLADIQCAKSGKPFVNNFHFSIAHTDGLTGVLVSNEPVGLDIELVRHIENAGDFSDVFTGDELEEIKRSGPEFFFRMWSMKEAILKLTGEGITDQQSAHAIKETGANKVAYKDKIYQVCPFIAYEKYIVTVAQTDRSTALRECFRATVEDHSLVFSSWPLIAVS